MRNILIVFVFATLMNPLIAGKGYVMEFFLKGQSAGQSVNGSIRSWAEQSGHSRTHIETRLGSDGITLMKMTTIVRADQPGKIYLINEAEKSYSLMDKGNSLNRADTSYRIEILGREKVSGYNCLHIRVFTGDRPERELWTTKEIKAPAALLSTGVTNQYFSNTFLLNALKAEGAEGFPVRIQLKEEGSATTIELQSLKEKTFSEQDFTVPADYTMQANPLEQLLKQMNLPSAEEIAKMSPEERASWMRRMQEQYKAR